MKRFFLVCFAVLLMISTAAADVDLSGMSVEELVRLRDAVSLELAGRQAPGDCLASWETRSGRVDLLSISCGTTEAGTRGVCLSFSFTNTSEEIACFRDHHWFDVYHDGIETDRPVMLDGVIIDTDGWSRDVMPGRTLEGLTWFCDLPGTEPTIDVSLQDRTSRPVIDNFITLELPAD